MAIIDFPNPWTDPLPLPKEQMTLYLLMMPDRADSKRMEIRETHLAHAAVAQENGWIVNGGATFSQSDPSRMVGSWCLARGTDEASLLAKFKQDVYNVRGAWDWDKVTIVKCGALSS